MAKGFKHLTKADRIKIEALLKAGHTIKEIADLLTYTAARYTEK